jgi:putative ABC transport system permease protein
MALSFRRAAGDLVRSWRTTGAILAMVSLGAGASGAAISLLTSTMRNPLNLNRPDEVVFFDNALPSLAGDSSRPDQMVDYKELLPGVKRLAVYGEHDVRVNIVADGRVLGASGAEVSVEFFDTLGVSMRFGRAFVESDFRSGEDRVIVIGDTLYRELYGDGSSPLGRIVRLNDAPFVVVGVMPAEMRFPRGSEFWIPVAQARDRIAAGPYLGYAVIGRLQQGLALPQAQAAVVAFAGTATRESPQSWPSHRKVTAVPLADDVTGSAKPALQIVTVVLFLTWIAAAANIFAMLMARAADRAHEIWLRRALGASPVALAQAFVAEAAVLAVASLACSLVAAVCSLRTIERIMPADYGGSAMLWPSAMTVWLSVGLALATGGLAVLPGIRDAARHRGDTAPRQTSGSRQSLARYRWPVLAQTTAAMALLAGTAVLASSVVRLQAVELGFQTKDRIVASVSIPDRAQTANRRATSVYDELIARIGVIPTVTAVGATSALPLSRTDAIELLFSVDGVPDPSRFKDRFALSTSVTPGYFKAIGIPLVRGRLFDDHDREDSQAVLIVNTALARHYGGAAGVIGLRLTLPLRSGQVVGVVGDVRHWGPTHEADPQIYAPQTQAFGTKLNSLVVDSTGDVTSVAGAIRRIVADLDPSVAVYDARPLTDVVRESTRVPRAILALLGAFAVVALCLAGVGVFAALTQFVASRKREIGVRMALGAGRAAVSWMIVGRGVTLALVGAGAGVVAAFVALHLLSATQFGILALTPKECVLGASILLGVALVACLAPTLTALRVDPAILLRQDQ